MQLKNQNSQSPSDSYASAEDESTSEKLSVANKKRDKKSQLKSKKPLIQTKIYELKDLDSEIEEIVG